MADSAPEFDIEDNNGSSNILLGSIPGSGTLNVPASPGAAISGFMLYVPGNKNIEVRWTGETNYLKIEKKERVFFNLRGKPTQIQFNNPDAGAQAVELVLYRQT